VCLGTAYAEIVQNKKFIFVFLLCVNYLQCIIAALVAINQHSTYLQSRGVVGRGMASLFSTGDTSPTPPTFWTEIRAKCSPLLQLVTY